MLSAKETEAATEGHPVQIAVNGKPVTVDGPRTTGLQIKEAAIAQGVGIQLDFVLYLELGPGQTKAIGDNDKFTVNKESSFTAIDNDDNS